MYAPLEAIVDDCGYEEGQGNYGGYMLLKHGGDFEPFYSLYGHLNPDSLVAKGTVLKRGESFAKIGDYDHNGNWFPHLHLQILNGRGYEEGYRSKGYCTAEDLPNIKYFCPSPVPLFRY